MRLVPDHFNALIGRAGQRVSWRPSRSCACRDPYSGSPDPSCEVCGGLGRVWDADVASVAAPSGVKVQRQWADFGMWMAGDVVVTLPGDQPVYAIAEGDRLALLDSTEPFSQVIPVGGRMAGLVASLARCTYLLAGVEADAVLPTLDANGALTWPGNDGPGAVQVVLAGRRHPEYFAFSDFSQDRAHQMGDPLPRRVVLRRFDLWGR